MGNKYCVSMKITFQNDKAPHYPKITQNTTLDQTNDFLNWIKFIGLLQNANKIKIGFFGGQET